MSNEKENTVRVNTRISKQANQWLDEQSTYTGVSKSGLIHLAVESYMNQKQAIASMKDVTMLLTQMHSNFKSLENKVEQLANRK